MQASARIAAFGFRLPWGRIAWLAGAAAATASGGFLVHGIASHWVEIAPLLKRASIPILSAGVVAYVVSAIAAAWVWLGWLEVMGVSMRRSLATSIALTSQLAKYIPGNVAHHLGKAALARQAGAPLSRVAGSIVGELLVAPVLAVAMLGFVLTLDPAVLPHLWTREVDEGGLRVAGAAVVASVAAMAVFFPKLVVSMMRRLSLESRNVRPGSAIRILVSGGVMFGAAGLSLHGVVLALAPAAEIAPGFSIAVFTLAWTAGFLTPGAPAGLGIREVLIVAGLSSIVGAPAAVGAAVLHRVVSAIGDVLACALGCALGLRVRGKTAPKKSA